MTLIYGPTDTAIPDGYSSPPLIITLPAMAIGDTTTLAYTSTVNGSPPANGLGIRLLSTSGGLLNAYDQPPPPQTAHSFTFTFTSAETASKWALFVGGGCTGCSMTVNGLEIYTNGVSGFPCVYGTEANPSAQTYEIITDTLIDVVVAAALVGTASPELIAFVETALAAIEGTIFVIPDCTTLPTGNNHLDLTDFSTLTAENLLSWFQYAAWSFFCQCTPAPGGSPPPTPPAAPVVTTPPGLPTSQPAPICDNTDLCTYLSQMQAELQSIIAQIGYLRGDLLLIQRQKVPFAYVPGTLTTGLSGDGQLTVQGILGLAVQVTTLPGVIGEVASDPTTYVNLGWISTGTPDGWRSSVPIRHNPQWVNVEPDDTLIGYSFSPLVVANIQTFVREP
jgi:hypothetical protein